MTTCAIGKESGQIVLFALLVFALLSLLSFPLLRFVSFLVQAERQTVALAQALQLAEAGLDKAAFELNQSSSYVGESNTSLGPGTFTTIVATIDAQSKRVTSTGFVSAQGQVYDRTVRATLSKSAAEVSFHYGVQAGTGGFIMNGGSTVNGNIYANASIVATNGVHITGSAQAANPPALSADQSNAVPFPITSCTSTTCVTFAQASATQDFGQSFQLTNSQPINNVQVYLKKIGSPPDITLKIVNDNNGVPGSTVYLSGTLSASSVTTSFGWVSVPLPTTPVLQDHQTYWLVLDTSSNSSRYYVIGANNNGYALGTAKVGRLGYSWSDPPFAGLDGYFQIFLGGGFSTLGGSDYVGGVYLGTTASDSAWAHTVKGASVTGNLYCQAGDNNNKPCDTSQPDPTPQPFPLSNANIQDWKNEASAGGTIVGDYHVGWAGATLGPKTITGNLLIDGGGILTVTGTLSVQSNLTLGGGSQIKLASSYGANSGVIVTDGYVVLAGGSSFSGSGQPGSYPFLITTSACPVTPSCNGNPAVSLSGGAGSVVVIAQEGNVSIGGGSALKEVTAKQITMTGGATLTYDSGLISAHFSSGPGGSWTFQPGSYVIQ